MSLSEDSLLGSDFTLQIGDGNSPEAFVDACSVNDVQGLGEAKPLVDVTTYCDDARTFIGGLREGNEVTLQMNLIKAAADKSDLFSHWDAGTNVNFRFASKDSPAVMYLQWGGALINWALQPPVGDKVQLSFTVKISGGVTRVGFDA
jgi:hypothetical protein